MSRRSKSFSGRKTSGLKPPVVPCPVVLCFLTLYPINIGATFFQYVIYPPPSTQYTLVAPMPVNKLTYSDTQKTVE